jgi:hypothetical protein
MSAFCHVTIADQHHIKNISLVFCKWRFFKAKVDQKFLDIFFDMSGSENI